MLGEETLLFPDGGDAFMRSLRHTAIYSSSVRVLTPLMPDLVGWGDICKELGGERYIIFRRFIKYFSWLKASMPDLMLLQREGVLRALVDETQVRDVLLAIRDTLIEAGPRGENALVRRSARRMPEILDRFPPCFSDLLILENLLREPSIVRPNERYNPHHLIRASHVFYLTAIGAIAEQSGLIPASWDPGYANVMWMYRQTLVRRSNAYPTRRSDVERRLARAVLRRHLPRMDDLPFDEVLLLRQKRVSELEAFRVGIAKLATEIDLEQPPHRIEAQARDLVSKEVDPAVHDLKAAMAVSRLDALQKIGKSWKVLAVATVPTALAAWAGAPMNLAASAGALGTLANVLFQGEIERRKLLRGSQWALLVRLDQQSRKGRTRAVRK